MVIENPDFRWADVIPEPPIEGTVELELGAAPSIEPEFDLGIPEPSVQAEVVEAAPAPELLGVGSPSRAHQAAEERLAEIAKRRNQRDSEIRGVLGEEYDPTDTFSGGVPGWFRQVDMARSRDITDQQAKFRQTFPEGDLIQLFLEDNRIEVLARTNKGEPFRLLGMGPKIAAAIGSEEAAGSLVGVLAGGFFGVALTGLGVVGGSLTKQQIERSRGYGQGEGGIMEALNDGALATVLDAVLRGSGRLVFGPALPASTRAALQDAIKAAEAEGLEALAIGQIGGPFKAGLYRQVGATSPRVQYKITSEQESLLRRFRQLGDDAMPDEAIAQILRAQKLELDSLLTMPRLSRVDAGAALAEGLDTYQRASRRVVNRLYAKAHELSDDVAFNLQDVQALAREIDLGVLGRSVREGESIRLSETPSGSLKNVVDDLLALDPNMSKHHAAGGEWTAFEQLKTLRTRLFDLKQSDDAGVAREARRLWQSITKTLDNPISGDPGFVSAYRAASVANRLREDTLTKLYVAQGLKTDTPTTLAQKYMKPGHATELATIRELIPTERWAEFQTAFMSDIVGARTPMEGLRRLESFRALDREGLALLANPRQVYLMERYLRARQQFEAGPIRKAIGRQLSEGERIKVLLKGTAGDVESAVRLSGGLDSQFAQSARAAIYKNILDESRIVTERGVEVIDAGKLLKSIGKWRKDEKLQHLLRPEDWERITRFERYAAPISETADIGGAMMAGALRQELVRAPVTMWSDAKRVGSRLIHTIMSNDLMAWNLSRKAYERHVSGAPEGLFPLRQLSVMLLVARNEFGQQGNLVSEASEGAASTLVPESRIAEPTWEIRGGFPTDSFEKGVEPVTLSKRQVLHPRLTPFKEIIDEAAGTVGLRPELLEAVIMAESSGKPESVSPAGAQGLMQLMPRTAQSLGVEDPFDPEQNIHAGSQYLARLIQQFGSEELGLAAYNWGQTNLRRLLRNGGFPDGLPAETREYIEKVSGLAQVSAGAATAP